jgi:hypothetical protein
MRTTHDKWRALDLLQPSWGLVFVALMLFGGALAVLPEWEAFPLRAAARLAGYLGFVAMLVPYLHIVRRCFRYRRGAPMRLWLRLHIGAAYLAFFFVLVHCRGRASTPLTLALLIVTWIVMISGAVGYYGQKLLYFLLPRLVAREYGLERLEAQRQHVLATAEGLAKKAEIQKAPEVVRKFCATAVAECLAPPYLFWRWLLRVDGTAQLSENWYQRALMFADAAQSTGVQTIWELVQTRHALDLEYRLHQLGRLWLLVHGPAAWALLLLMIEHALMSMWYGGF